MVHAGTSSLEPLVEDVLTRVSRALTSGLAPEQATWAIEAYRRTVLPYTLRFAVGDADQDRRRRAAIVVEDILAEVAGLNPSEKWEAILRAYYYSAVLPLSDAAFELAQRRFLHRGTDGESRQLVTDLRAEVRGLLSQIDHYPSAREALSETISETLLDLRYAEGEEATVSLRMGRVRRSRQAKMNQSGPTGAPPVPPSQPAASPTLAAPGTVCATCGAALAAGVRFCTACGAPVAPPRPAGLCPRCNAQNPPTSRFCTACGGSLAV